MIGWMIWMVYDLDDRMDGWTGPDFPTGDASPKLRTPKPHVSKGGGGVSGMYDFLLNDSMFELKDRKEGDGGETEGPPVDPPGPTFPSFFFSPSLIFLPSPGRWRMEAKLIIPDLSCTD